MKNFETLKKYKNLMELEDYRLLKRDIKLFNILIDTIEFMKVGGVYYGARVFLHEDINEFEYFVDNISKVEGYREFTETRDI